MTDMLTEKTEKTEITDETSEGAASLAPEASAVSASTVGGEGAMLMTPDEVKCAMEAMLFAAGYPLSLDRIGAVLSLDRETVETYIDEMIPAYAGRGIRLIRLADSCQLVTREEFAPYIRLALGIRRGGNLSRASLETLAIVAYHQPVTRAYIDEVRGVDTGYVVSSLLEKGLIASVGRMDAPGRPTLYGTTEAFLRVFGLDDLTALPSAEQFLAETEVNGDDPDATAALMAEGSVGASDPVTEAEADIETE